jgi:hypothetical protein
MALWALTDNLAGAPKWLTPITTVAPASFATSGAFGITIAGHSFTEGDRVTLTNSTGTALAGTRVANGLYFVKVIDADTITLHTNANLSAGTRLQPSSGGVGDHTLQVTPTNVFFADVDEVQVAGNREKGFHVPGWYTYSEGTGGRSGRKDVELLCAVSAGGAVAATVGDDGLTGTSSDEDDTLAD